MIHKHLYWCCPTITCTTKGPLTAAILLSPLAVDALDVVSFSAFLLNKRSVTPVKCHRYTASEVATGQDAKGNPVTFFNGEEFHTDLAAEAIAAAQNQTLLYLDGVSLPVAEPTLLSTDGSVAFVRYSVIVDLLCMTMAELPDFTANLACSRAFEDMIRGDWARPPVTVVDELEAYGRKARLRPGIILPVNYPCRDGDKSGAVVLDRKLTSSHARFDAHLFTFHADCHPEPGTLLSRRVTWREGSNEQTRSCSVARIVSIGEPEV